MNKFFQYAFAAAILLCGCASKDKGAFKEPKTPQRQATATVIEPQAPPKARILPVNGRIAHVNRDLRFVILDFTNSRQPVLEERLGVYRVGQKVAEIKVSGPFLNSTVAANIVAGEVLYGDEVKAE